MEYRQLGKTGLKVSVIGIGTEHLRKVSVEEITRIFRLALREGINYIDLVWSLPNITDGLSEAIERETIKPIIALHLGSCISNGKYKRSRNPVECEKHLRALLDLFNMDSAPVLNIHYVANLKVWKEINRKGIFSLAKKLKEQRLAEAISVSTHEPEVIMLATESGVDSIMHQVSVANHMYTARDEALRKCSKLGVGVVAMKPFVGGELLRAGQKVRIAAYKTGWKTMTVHVPAGSTSTKLLSYTLSQPSVCTAVTGVSSLRELVATLTYLKASNNEKDYSQIIESLERDE
ncbi:MAG: aldo/keto reductase [Candidatus Bathyarchaeota archaeon]|nr:aldo/keto reductase [Candidatus Bathyarchaeota archaeon]